MKTPGGEVSAFAPKAWNSEMTMRTIVPVASQPSVVGLVYSQPWNSENGRWTKSSVARDSRLLCSALMM